MARRKLSALATGSFALAIITCMACGKTASSPCILKSVPSTATAPPEGAFVLESASLGIREADAGGLDETAAKSIGFDLDGKCTASDSKDVCTPAPGAFKDEQDDGVQGIDNGFALNVAPVGFDLGFDYWSSATITLVTQSGVSELDVVNPYTQFAIPLLAPRLIEDASGGGTLVGRIPAEQLVDSVALDGAGDPALCNPTDRDVIAFVIRDAADLLLDGTNTPPATCDALSIGITFSARSAVSIPQLKPGRCVTASDGGVDQ